MFQIVVGFTESMMCSQIFYLFFSLSRRAIIGKQHLEQLLPVRATPAPAQRVGGPQHLYEGGDAQLRAAGDGDASRRPGNQPPGGRGQDDRAQTVSTRLCVCGGV